MDQVFVNIPDGSVKCTPGDYLIFHRPDARWQVYRVEDLLLVKRLVAMPADPSALMIEGHALDSVAPAYFNEVHLLLTAFAPDFIGEPEAVQAIHGQTLIEHVKGLLRPSHEFSEPNCRVIRPAPEPT